jgi:dTDP-4-amino-4,6-dideoxygalactose transaminase
VAGNVKQRRAHVVIPITKPVMGETEDVITVSHSFSATANASRDCGATPVFIDIEPRS